MDLVSSLCRLLHNFLTGERMKPLTRGEMEALLNLTGNILDQPSRSSALLSVTIALLGKVLPLSFTDLVIGLTLVLTRNSPHALREIVPTRSSEHANRDSGFVYFVLPSCLYGPTLSLVVSKS